MPALTWQRSFLEKAGFVSAPDFKASPHAQFVVRGRGSSFEPITVTRTSGSPAPEDSRANQLTLWLVGSAWVITLGGDTRVAYAFVAGRRGVALDDVEHWRTCGGFAAASETCPRCSAHEFSGKEHQDWPPFQVLAVSRAHGAAPLADV